RAPLSAVGETVANRKREDTTARSACPAAWVKRTTRSTAAAPALRLRGGHEARLRVCASGRPRRGRVPHLASRGIAQPRALLGLSEGPLPGVSRSYTDALARCRSDLRGTVDTGFLCR